MTEQEPIKRDDVADNNNHRYRPRMDDYNGWADFWRNNIGVNVIPANTAEKKTYTQNGVHGKTNPYHRNYTTLGSTIIN